MPTVSGQSTPQPCSTPFPFRASHEKVSAKARKQDADGFGTGFSLRIICFQALGWVPEFLAPAESAKALHSSTDDILAAWPRLPHGWSPGLAAPKSEPLLGPTGTCKQAMYLTVDKTMG